MNSINFPSNPFKSAQTSKTSKSAPKNLANQESVTRGKTQTEARILVHSELPITSFKPASKRKTEVAYEELHSSKERKKFLMDLSKQYEASSNEHEGTGNIPNFSAKNASNLALAAAKGKLKKTTIKDKIQEKFFLSKAERKSMDLDLERMERGHEPGQGFLSITFDKKLATLNPTKYAIRPFLNDLKSEHKEISTLAEKFLKKLGCEDDMIEALKKQDQTAAIERLKDILDL